MDIRPNGAVPLTGSQLTVDTLVALARSTREVTLSAAAEERIRHSREVLLSQQRARVIYGRNSGVGALKGTAVPNDVSFDLNMLRSHATSGGGEVPAETIRAMMVIRINQLARGGAGVSLDACRRLVELVNRNEYPRIYWGGALGTGDMPQLAAVGLLLATPSSSTEPQGRGSLARGDAIGLISSSALTLADSALAIHGMLRMLKASTVVAALTWLAVRGNREHFSDAATPSLRTPDAIRVARWLTSLLGDEVYAAPRVQESFALRVFPSSVGAVLGVRQQVLGITEELINASVENPLIDASAGVVVHHGGFYNLDLALALDSAAMGLAHLSTFALSRIGLLTNTSNTGVPEYLGDGSPGSSGVMMLEYLAAWHVASMRAAANPASVQVVSVSHNVEENASFASVSAHRLADLCSSYASIVACELVTSVRALRLARITPCGPRLTAALAICDDLPADLADRDLTEDIAAATNLLSSLADALEG
ncbi:aromatic amino acid ammonia-lyase [Nocardioides terrisoli]|uniref:aromatic amino acid ammonia-lyase n=1 Tax=Nocardioides terrisoli TaxID=3388267 RepID=UPI00287BBEF1|nr:aromatic amino acid ammonia-lyase [Nocardioides marmorisolisilvae]